MRPSLPESHISVGSETIDRLSLFELSLRAVRLIIIIISSPI